MQWNPAIQWSLLLLCAGLFIFSDFLSANWGKTGHIPSILLMIVLAPFSYFLFGVINKYMTLSVSSAIVNMLIVIGGVLVGIVYFKEGMSIPQGIGFVLALAAIYLLNMK
jgi:multidrug transporter EmrE-like cation transporter